MFKQQRLYRLSDILHRLYHQYCDELQDCKKGTQRLFSPGVPFLTKASRPVTASPAGAAVPAQGRICRTQDMGSPGCEWPYCGIGQADFQESAQTQSAEIYIDPRKSARRARRSSQTRMPSAISESGSEQLSYLFL